MLKSNCKLYIVDLGLRNHILPKRTYDLGFGIENIVYFELLRRGYQVNIGKLRDMEIDFVARKNDEIIYYQVTADMTHDETFEREMRPLKLIKDNYEKIVLTLDRFTLGNYEGIKVMNVVDWLFGKNIEELRKWYYNKKNLRNCREIICMFSDKNVSWFSMDLRIITVKVLKQL